MQAGEIVNEMKHFFVIGIIIERNYRNTIINLESKGINRIIYNNHIFKSSISNNSQVFNIKPFFGKYAMLTIHSKLNKFSIGINIVKNSIGVSLMRCSEHHDLEVFISFFKTLHHIRSNIDTSLTS